MDALCGSAGLLLSRRIICTSFPYIGYKGTFLLLRGSMLLVPISWLSPDTDATILFKFSCESEPELTSLFDRCFLGNLTLLATFRYLLLLLRYLSSACSLVRSIVFNWGLSRSGSEMWFEFFESSTLFYMRGGFRLLEFTLLVVDLLSFSNNFFDSKFC